MGGNCIKSGVSRDQLKATWDMVFANTTICPDVPLPEPPAPTPPSPPTPLPPPSPVPAPASCKQNRDSQSCTTSGCSWCTYGTHSTYGSCKSQCSGEIIV